MVFAHKKLSCGCILLGLVISGINHSILICSPRIRVRCSNCTDDMIIENEEKANNECDPSLPDNVDENDEQKVKEFYNSIDYSIEYLKTIGWVIGYYE